MLSARSRLGTWYLLSDISTDQLFEFFYDRPELKYDYKSNKYRLEVYICYFLFLIPFIVKPPLLTRMALMFGVVSGAVSSVAAQQYLSLADIDLSEQTLHVTAASAQQVIQVEIDGGAVIGRITFPVPISGTVLSPDGKWLYATGGVSVGEVFVVDLGAGQIVQSIPVGHSPNAPVLSPDGQRLYVCNQFDNDVSIIDLIAARELARVPVVREPVAADVSKDGRYLFVANLIPQGRADGDYIASTISVIDTEALSASQIPLVNGAEGVRGLKVSPDGQYVFATHIMARYQVPVTQLERGWVITNALSVIRVSDQSLLYTVLLDDMTLGFPNPWAIGFSGDGAALVVSSAGGQEVSVVNLPQLLEKVQSQPKPADNEVHLYAHNDLSFLSGIRKRIALNGNGPRSLVVQGDRAYVANYFTDSIDVVDFSNLDAVTVESIELNPGMQLTQARQGELFFHDGSLCFQKWLSCSSCHPDARTDALNWDNLNDGIGNPKNVKSMLQAHLTPPMNWLAVREDFQVSVRAGLRHTQFSVRPEADALAIDAYIESLEPTPSPYLVDGDLSESARRGQRLFKTQRCNRCHDGELYTDMEQHEVGTATGVDVGRPIDTPSLIELWRTAPYMHDGRAATVRDVIMTDSHAAIFERMKWLDDQEIADLEQFLLSL